jgi:hypothetical protein
MNPGTGEVTQLLQDSDFSDGIPDLAQGPDGFVYTTEGDSSGLFRIHPSTLAVTAVGDLDGGSGRGATFVGDTLYVADGQSLYTVDLDAGTETLVAAFTLTGFPGEITGFSIGSMTTRPADNAVFGILKEGGGGGSDETFLVRIDVATAEITNIGPNGVQLDGLAFVPSSLFPGGAEE